MLETTLFEIDKAKKAVVIAFYEEVYWDVFDAHEYLLKPSFNEDTVSYFEQVYYTCKLVGCYDRHSLRHAFFLSLFLGQYCVADILYKFRLRNTVLDKYFLEYIDTDTISDIMDNLFHKKITFDMGYFNHLYKDGNNNDVLKSFYTLKEYKGSLVRNSKHLDENLEKTWVHHKDKSLSFGDYKQKVLKFGRLYTIDNRHLLLAKDIGLQKIN